MESRVVDESSDLSRYEALLESMLNIGRNNITHVSANIMQHQLQQIQISKDRIAAHKRWSEEYATVKHCIASCCLQLITGTRNDAQTRTAMMAIENELILKRTIDDNLAALNISLESAAYFTDNLLTFSPTQSAPQNNQPAPLTIATTPRAASANQTTPTHLAQTSSLLPIVTPVQSPTASRKRQRDDTATTPTHGTAAIASPSSASSRGEKNKVSRVRMNTIPFCNMRFLPTFPEIGFFFISPSIRAATDLQDYFTGLKAYLPMDIEFKKYGRAFLLISSQNNCGQVNYQANHLNTIARTLQSIDARHQKTIGYAIDLRRIINRARDSDIEEQTLIIEGFHAIYGINPQLVPAVQIKISMRQQLKNIINPKASEEKIAPRQTNNASTSGIMHKITPVIDLSSAVDNEERPAAVDSEERPALADSGYPSPPSSPTHFLSSSSLSITTTFNDANNIDSFFCNDDLTPPSP